MNKLSFEEGKLKEFIKDVQQQLHLNSDQLGQLINLSGRTIRDWKREKFKPTKSHIIKLSELSGVNLPKYDILPQFWNNRLAARLGGKKTYRLYGLLGTRESRRKGGVMSWYSRKRNPEILLKYTNTFKKPRNSIDLAEFIGIMLGDGCLTTQQCTIYLSSQTDQDYAVYVKNLIIKLFKLTPSLYKHKKYNMLIVSISGINLVKYLTLKGLRVGNKVNLQVGIPDWVLTKPSYIKACIRGLIDTDGCFAIHKYKVNNKEYSYPKIAFKNHSEPILNFVYQRLIQLRFNPKRTFKYHVWLHNQSEVKRYLKDIGTSNYKPVVNKILYGGVA